MKPVATDDGVTVIAMGLDFPRPRHSPNAIGIRPTTVVMAVMKSAAGSAPASTIASVLVHAPATGR